MLFIDISLRLKVLFHKILFSRLLKILRISLLSRFLLNVVIHKLLLSSFLVVFYYFILKSFSLIFRFILHIRSLLLSFLLIVIVISWLEPFFRICYDVSLNYLIVQRSFFVYSLFIISSVLARNNLSDLLLLIAIFNLQIHSIFILPTHG